MCIRDRFNSDTTKGLARQLAGNLGCLYTMVPIQEAVDFTVQQITQARLEHLGGGTAQQLQMAPLVLENIQARDRSARVLAGLAAAFGAVSYTHLDVNKRQVLQHMCRHYTTADFGHLVTDIRKRLPGVAITSEDVYKRQDDGLATIFVWFGGFKE